MENKADLLKKAVEGLKALTTLAEHASNVIESYDIDALLKMIPLQQKTLFEGEKEETSEDMTFDQIQKILAEKARNGFRNEVHTLLSKYGANRLSDIDPKLYGSLGKDAEEYCRDISKSEISEAAQWILDNRKEDDLRELLLFHNATSIDDLPKDRYAGFLFDARRL